MTSFQYSNLCRSRFYEVGAIDCISFCVLVTLYYCLYIIKKLFFCFIGTVLNGLVCEPFFKEFRF